jgi:4-amino-4-deoxyprephenate dehydrogenase
MPSYPATSVIIGGNGGVGRLFGTLLSGAGPVTLADLRHASPLPGIPGSTWSTESIIADAQHPNKRLRELLATADIVMLALPEPVALAAAGPVARHMRQGALLVETLSVKTSVGKILADISQRHDLEALGVNPMFAPELGFPGRPVIVVELRGGPRCRRMEELIGNGGGRLIAMSPLAHDQLTAALQVATHASILAFGQALRALDTDVNLLVDTAPPPHLNMLALLARVLSMPREVYQDIQVSHPYGERTRRALSDAITYLDDASMTHPEELDSMFDQLTDWLGPRRESLAAECARIFAGMGRNS